MEVPAEIGVEEHLNVAQRLVRLLRTRGVKETLRRAWKKIRRLGPRRAPVHPFDVEHGVDTGGLIKTKLEHGKAYWGTAPSLLRGSLDRWEESLAGSGFAVADYCFVDLGCGKGRAMMLASERPFRRVIGVELDPKLVDVAEINLAKWQARPHACQDIKVVLGDAVAYPMPDMPVLLYLFNPFDASLIQRIADGLKGERRYPIDVMYTRPDHAEIFEALPGVRTLYQGEIWFTPEDWAADVFETRRQQCFLYRLGAA